MQPKRIGATFSKIIGAVKDMPQPMRTTAPMNLLQRCAMRRLRGNTTKPVARSLVQTADNRTLLVADVQLFYGRTGSLFRHAALLTAPMLCAAIAVWRVRGTQHSPQIAAA